MAKDASAKIDEYIADLPEPAKEICTKLRVIIHQAVNFNFEGMVCGVAGGRQRLLG